LAKLAHNLLFGRVAEQLVPGLFVSRANCSG
jgi:hypothetical protein